MQGEVRASGGLCEAGDGLQRQESGRRKVTEDAFRCDGKPIAARSCIQSIRATIILQVLLLFQFILTNPRAAKTGPAKGAAERRCCVLVLLFSLSCVLAVPPWCQRPPRALSARRRTAGASGSRGHKWRTRESTRGAPAQERHTTRNKSTRATEMDARNTNSATRPVQCATSRASLSSPSYTHHRRTRSTCTFEQTASSRSPSGCAALSRLTVVCWNTWLLCAVDTFPSLSLAAMPNTSPPASDDADRSASHFERMDLNEPAAAPAPAPAAAAAASSSASASSALSPTSAAALQSVVSGCITVLVQLLDKLMLESDQPLLQTVPLDAKRLNDYAEIVTHQLTRFVLFSSSGDLADSAAALPGLAEEIGNHLSGVSCVMRSMLAPNLSTGGAIPGPTQRAGILAVHHAILSGMRALIVQLQKHLLSKSSTKLQTALTGQVWALLDKELKSLPLTNAHAIGKGVLAQCALIKDASEEIRKIKIKENDAAAAEGKNGGASDEKDDGADDDDDDDDDFDDLDDDDAESTLSPSEFALVPPSIQLVAISQNLLKAVYLFLLKCGHPENQLANVEFMEQLLARVKIITRGADELVESLYAPQDRALAAQAHAHLCSELRKLAEGVVAQHRAQHPPATWPMKDSSSSSSSSASASAPAPAAAAAAAPASAEDGPIPVDEPARWLQKVSSVIQLCEQDAAAAMANNGGTGAGAK